MFSRRHLFLCALLVLAVGASAQGTLSWTTASLQNGATSGDPVQIQVSVTMANPTCNVQLVNTMATTSVTLLFNGAAIFQNIKPGAKTQPFTVAYRSTNYPLELRNADTGSVLYSNDVAFDAPDQLLLFSAADSGTHFSNFSCPAWRYLDSSFSVLQVAVTRRFRPTSRAECRTQTAASSRQRQHSR